MNSQIRSNGIIQATAIAGTVRTIGTTIGALLRKACGVILGLGVAAVMFAGSPAQAQIQIDIASDGQLTVSVPESRNAPTVLVTEGINEYILTFPSGSTGGIWSAAGGTVTIPSQPPIDLRGDDLVVSFPQGGTIVIPTGKDHKLTLSVKGSNFKVTRAVKESTTGKAAKKKVVYSKHLDVTMDPLPKRPQGTKGATR